MEATRLIQPCDVGSLPFRDEPDKPLGGANHFAASFSNDSSEFFERVSGYAEFLFCEIANRPSRKEKQLCRKTQGTFCNLETAS